MDLTHRTVLTRPANTNSIPQVTETLQSVNMDRHFPRLLPLSTEYSKDLQLKTRRDVPHQKVINYLLFNTLLFHFTETSSKTVEHKMALCILLELSDGIFELYHDLTSRFNQNLL